MIGALFSLGLRRESLIIKESPLWHEVPEFSLGRIIAGSKIQLVYCNRIPDPL